MSLDPEHHEEREKAPRISQKQRGGHGPNHASPHAHAGADQLVPGKQGVVPRHLFDARSDVHGQIHDRPRSTQDQRPGEKPLQVQKVVPGVKERLGIGQELIKKMLIASEEVMEVDEIKIVVKLKKSSIKRTP